MGGRLPNISGASALPGYRLSVRWRDGSEAIVDFAGLLDAHPAFAPLHDEAEFAKVEVIDWGGGVEWPSGADYAADALFALASEQRGSRRAAE